VALIRSSFGDRNADQAGPPARTQLPALVSARTQLPALVPARTQLPALVPARTQLPALVPARTRLPALVPARLRQSVAGGAVAGQFPEHVTGQLD
jgi:hypothetical protein